MSQSKQHKKILYVGEVMHIYIWLHAAKVLFISGHLIGGLDETVDEAILHAAFIPFGEIKEVQIPKDNATQKNRGFGFVDFEEVADAAAAMDNMNSALDQDNSFRLTMTC
jgi:hypothetical protein